ncbi:MAG: hypothetical protein R2692_05575 [Microbacterium sp.]
MPDPPHSAAPYDPLRLCVFRDDRVDRVRREPITAVLAFALVAIAGFTRARRAGLLRSRTANWATPQRAGLSVGRRRPRRPATPLWVMVWARVFGLDGGLSVPDLHDLAPWLPAALGTREFFVAGARRGGIVFS